MPVQIVPLEGIDKLGVIKDSPASTLPPGAWTDARNVRFDDGAIRRMKGQLPIFVGHGLGDIQHIAYWENPNKRCYVVINREGNRDYIYLVGIGGGGPEVSTRSTVSFSPSENWTSTQFNGGYSFIVNNGIEAPHHSTVQLGGSSSINGQPPFAMLPGWESYISGSYVAEYLSVSTDILIAYGNLLVAGSLTERSRPQLPGISNIVVNSMTSATVTFAAGTSLAVGDTFAVVDDPNYTFMWIQSGDGSLIDPDVTVTQVVPSEYNQIYTVTEVDVTLTQITCTATFTQDMAVSTDLGTDNPYDGELPLYSMSGDVTSYWLTDEGQETPAEIVRDLNGVVRTSDVAAPGNIPQSWNPFMTGANTADEIALADAGRITAIRELRGNLFVFTSDTITQLRVSTTGLTQVPITKEYGALTQSGVFGFQGSLVVIGSDDIYIFAGNPGDIKSIADGRVRLDFYDTLNAVTFRNMQIRRNQIHDEIWICYPTMASTNGRLDVALIWDYITNTWTYRDLPRPRTIAVGPVEGMSDGGTFLEIPTDGTTYSLTVTNANGQSTEQGNEGAPFSGPAAYNDLLSAINTDINGQAGLTSRIVSGGLVVNDARLGSNGWTYVLEINDVVISQDTEFTPTVNDNERPWSNTVLNEAKNFIVMAGTNSIDAAELGYSIGSAAYLQKTQMRFAPSKDTEHLGAVYMETESAGVPVMLDVMLKTRNTTGGTINSTHPYVFDTVNNYKIDTHLTSRLIDIEIREPENSSSPWDIASIEIDVGKGGTR